jgi:hypothetical protein
MRITKMLRTLAVSSVVVAASAAGALAETGISATGGAISATAGALRFEGFPEGAPTITCLVVLDGTIASTIPKSFAARVGRITSGSFRNATTLRPLCDTSIGAESAELTLLNLPWTITAVGFDGELPEIDEFIVRVSGISVRLLLLSLATSCTYGGNLRATTNGNAFEGIAEISPESEGLPSTRSEGAFAFLCPSQGHITEGTFDLSRTIAVELI